MNALAKFGEIPFGRMVVIAIVLAGFYYLVAFDNGSSFKNQIAGNLQAKEELNKEALKVEKDLEEINQLKAARERDSEKLNVLLAYIPEKMTKTELMRTLGNEAKTVGVSINQIKDTSSQGKKSEFYEEVGVKVDLSGNFAQLMLFMANLTKLNQILSVETLEIKSQTSSDVQILSMSATILGYRYLPMATSGAKK